ncbi:MAG: SPOR domain-containing protein [Balneolaceae bacterium]|nr:SPOR domain-containing protein [Balneolaceae bacterium]
MKYVFLFSFLILLGCASSEPTVQPAEQPQTTEESTSENTDNAEEGTGEESTEEDVDSYPYLSSLSDTYLNRSNSIPKGYERIKVEVEEEEKDLFEGYRVQIYSGPDVALADTTAKHFRVWSAANIDGYVPETYTFFKPPYYRVHVGDFHEREKAIEFSNLIKRRFRDSWVVYDRVNPYNVPADTTMIYIIR